VYIPRTPWEAALSGRGNIVSPYAILSDRDRYFVATNNIDREDSIDQAMDIIIERLAVGDTLWLGTNDGAYPSLYTERYASFRDRTKSQRLATWSTDSLTYSGYVVLSGFHYEYDENPRFVAGIFAFTARNEDSTQFIEVTEGRFDIKFNH
jgi:hypothetical protein